MEKNLQQIKCIYHTSYNFKKTKTQCFLKFFPHCCVGPLGATPFEKKMLDIDFEANSAAFLNFTCFALCDNSTIKNWIKYCALMQNICNLCSNNGGMLGRNSGCPIEYVPMSYEKFFLDIFDAS